MKFRIVFLFCAFALFVSSQAFAQKAASRSFIKKAEVKLSFVETVRVKSNAGSVTKMGFRWLKIEVTYSFADSTRKSTDWIDDMKVGFQVLFPSHYKGRNYTALMTGEVVFWSVHMDDKKHRVVGYVPPQILRRYNRTGSKLNKNLAGSIFAMVTFYNKKGKVIGREFGAAKKQQSNKNAIYAIFARADEQIGGPGSKYFKVKGAILSRDKTPWGSIDFDAYDLIKMDVNK